MQTDYDPEGLSIPAQRAACYRKAAQMGVEIIEEYIEPGRSGRGMDQRPAFLAMLDRLRRQRDVDYVVVYKLSRMNRNRVDDALVLMKLRKLGVALVSATESIDDTPVGQLMHGILAAFNEFRSAEDGADISFKMGEKARRGGTLGRAPLGYLNVRKRFEGREIRTIAVDPERGPFIKLAFELYATGEYTIEGLAQTLADRGLTTRPGRYGAGPVSTSKLNTVLRDRYYLGYVNYKGVEYAGRHEPLVTEDLFERVNRLLNAKSCSGERERVHQHYLKGSVWCGECHKHSRESRLIVQRAVGRRGGEYFYFFCRGRQRSFCQAPYISYEGIEDAVASNYQTVRFTAQFQERVRGILGRTLADEQGANRLLRQQLNVQLARLDRQEENLLDLASDAALPKDKLRSRLSQLQRERERLQDQLERTSDQLEVGAALLDAALKLLDNPYELYRQAGPAGRRLLNQAIFLKLYVDAYEVTDAKLASPFAELLGAQRQLGQVGYHRGNGTEAETSDDRAILLVTALSGGGSSKKAMVDLRGLEPLTSSMPWRRSTGLSYRPRVRTNASSGAPDRRC